MTTLSMIQKFLWTVIQIPINSRPSQLNILIPFSIKNEGEFSKENVDSIQIGRTCSGRMFRGGAKEHSLVTYTVYLIFNIAKVALQHLGCNKDNSSG